MGIFKEIPPTAGFAFSWGDFCPFTRRNYPSISLEDNLKNYLGVKTINITYSGTAAFYFILEALKGLSGKKTVVIPAYICPLVPLAIRRAQLSLEVCDTNGDSFDFDYLALENICKNNRDILAIVPTHLAGIPIDFNRINEIAKRYGVFTVEDCAQALGAEYKSKKVGTLGDFSFFSFARGKGFTIYEGGAALANNEKYSHLLAAKIQNLARKDFISESIKVLELIGYWIFYNPYLFWFVFSLPQIFWQWQGKNLRAAAEQYSVDFATSRVSNLRKFLGCLSFYRLDEEIKSQREKAAYYLRALNGVSGLSLIKEPDKAKATYPYLVLLFDDIQRRQKILTLLRRRGLGASIVYLSPITGYDYLKSIVPDKTFPLASNINQRQITLSTNSFLKERDLAAIAEIIKNNE